MTLENEFDQSLANISNQTYNDKENRQHNVNGFQLQNDFNGNKHTVYKNGKKVILGFRGTVPTDLEDLKTDASLVLGKHREHWRFKEALKTFDEVQRRYPDSEIFTTGHSLGGALANHVARNRERVRSVSFNAGHSPLDDVMLLSKENFRNEKNYRTKYDPISLNHLGNVKTVKRKKYKNPHSLDNFL
jgi:esterase/lipase